MLPLTTRIRPALRPDVAAVLLAVPLLAGAVHASEVTIKLNGKVQTFAGIGNPNAAQLLGAKGVQVGTPASLDLTLDDTSLPIPVDVPYPHLKYLVPIIDVKITVGEWDAHLAPPPGMEFTNFVEVTDNGDYIGSQFDGWNGTALGVDTDNILSQGSTPAYGTFFLHFLNEPPAPGTDDALVQDLKQYKTESTARFYGVGGSLTVDFAKAPGGDDAALCRYGELKAAAKLGSSLLKGLGKLVAAPPESDPFGVAKEALLLDVSDAFGIGFLKAIDKAQKKGGSAPLGESGKDYATTYLMEGLEGQADAITAGVDTANVVDRALRGKILKALAAESRAEFLAQAKNIKSEDLVKLTNALAKARDKLAGAVEKAVDKAGKQNVFYAGPNAASISADLEPFVDAFVDLTSTGL